MRWQPGQEVRATTVSGLEDRVTGKTDNAVGTAWGEKVHTSDKKKAGNDVDDPGSGRRTSR